MRPDIGRFIEVAAAHVAMRLAPALGAGYEQSNTLVLAALLICVREEFERAAARRVEENGEMRRIFAQASEVVDEPELCRALATAAAGGDESLLVTDLERENASLRALLIRLHAYVEEQSSAAARRLEEEIWRELAASTERRRLSFGAF